MRGAQAAVAGGKDFDRSQIVERIAAQIPGLERVVRFGYLDDSCWEDGFVGLVAAIPARE